MTDSRITPAMRAWCKRLANPAHCTLHETGTLSFQTRGVSGAGKPTYVIVGRLEDAGLITWDGPVRGNRRALLTDAGREAAK